MMVFGRAEAIGRSRNLPSTRSPGAKSVCRAVMPGASDIVDRTKQGNSQPNRLPDYSDGVLVYCSSSMILTSSSDIIVYYCIVLCSIDFVCQTEKCKEVTQINTSDMALQHREKHV